MAYCTEQDLIDRGWGEEVASLSDKTGELGGEINTEILDQAISDACAKIDSYLVGLVALPIATPSPYVIRCACDITRFYLYDIGVIPNVRLAYEEAIAFFEQVHLRKSSILALLGAPLLETTPDVVLQVPVLTAPVAAFSDEIMAKM
jgi:phage gp36-like protein